MPQFASMASATNASGIATRVLAYFAGGRRGGNAAGMKETP
jgi:hypothetical protein